MHSCIQVRCQGRDVPPNQKENITVCSGGHNLLRLGAALCRGLMTGPLAARVERWHACALSPWVLWCQGLQTTVCYETTQIQWRVNFCSKRSVSLGHGGGYCGVITQTRSQTSPKRRNSSGFYSCYFLIPKKGGSSLQPILDLRVLNIYGNTCSGC